MKAAAGGLVDVVLDLMPPSVDARVVRTAAMTVREFGRIALMGGVGAAGAPISPCPIRGSCTMESRSRGQWMFPPAADQGMVKLIRAGLVELDHWEVARFSLDRANEAVAHAAKNGGPFRMTVIAP